MHVINQTKVELKLNRSVRRCITARAEGKYELALRRHLRLQPVFDKAEPKYRRHFYCGLGRTYRLLGRNVEAIRQYETALRLEPTDEEGRQVCASIECNIAYALVDLNQLEEAHAFLDHAEEYFSQTNDDANLGETRLTRADVYFMQGKFTEACGAAYSALTLLWFYFDSGAKDRAVETLMRCWQASRGS
ncbi:MAG: Tetratricopeptide repeat [Acidobacteriota bacterium]|jgi:tetratricopeptide (TPR) repeat protein|nr:Tetratricopeptide repeat [Acidobacteriota bacterium]